MKKIFLFLLSVSIFWLNGCGGSQVTITPELRAELDSYKKQLEQQEKSISDLQDQLAKADPGELTNEVSGLKSDVNTNRTDIRRTRTAVNSLQSALEDMRSASPLIDSTNRILLDDIQLLKSQLKELDKKISESRSTGTVASNRSSAPPRTGLPASANTATPLPPQELRAKYVNTLSQYQNSNYAEAQRGFEEILRSNPSSDLADNAQYWIGECLYMLKKYEQAIVAFEKVFTFSDRGKYDYAQFKLGLCYRKLGNNEKARDEFERLVNYYKDSELRAQAQNILNKLK